MTPSFRALGVCYVDSTTEFVSTIQFKRGEIPHDQIKGEVMRDDNISDKKPC